MLYEKNPWAGLNYLSILHMAVLKLITQWLNYQIGLHFTDLALPCLQIRVVLAWAATTNYHRVGGLNN